ncbi:MAG: hypothetical protein OEZ09_12375, partial [Betaproteobacteria bacterium]|nr:hypothetical protein [Betaproteobacteria bacterium]
SNCARPRAPRSHAASALNQADRESLSTGPSPIDTMEQEEVALDAILGAHDGHTYRCNCFVGPVSQHGRRQVVARLRPVRGERIRKVGTGSGVSLPMYPAGVCITGVTGKPAALYSRA